MAEKKEPPSKRTLVDDVPELKEYLKQGVKVLDVGCGSGTITLGVATAVKPGEVVGVDPSEDRINTARDWAAQATCAGNISFMIGDSHQLDFPDNTFDVVYSHTVTHFFIDPTKALNEQKRVTKKGGWVIASGIRDISQRYPACPNWEKVWGAWILFHDSLLKKYQSSGDDPAKHLRQHYELNPNFAYYYDLHAGRKCPEWFSEVGFTDLRISTKVRTLQYQGSDEMKPCVIDILALDDLKDESQKHVVWQHERMIAEGFLDRETISRAMEEARAWYKNPRAFNYWLLVFAAGRA